MVDLLLRNPVSIPNYSNNRYRLSHNNNSPRFNRNHRFSLNLRYKPKFRSNLNRKLSLSLRSRLNLNTKLANNHCNTNLHRCLNFIHSNRPSLSQSRKNPILSSSPSPSNNNRNLNLKPNPSHKHKRLRSRTHKPDRRTRTIRTCDTRTQTFRHGHSITLKVGRILLVPSISSAFLGSRTRFTTARTTTTSRCRYEYHHHYYRGELEPRTIPGEAESDL